MEAIAEQPYRPSLHTRTQASDSECVVGCCRLAKNIRLRKRERCVPPPRHVQLATDMAEGLQSVAVKGVQGVAHIGKGMGTALGSMVEKVTEKVSGQALHHTPWQSDVLSILALLCIVLHITYCKFNRFYSCTCDACDACAP